MAFSVPVKLEVNPELLPSANDSVSPEPDVANATGAKTGRTKENKPAIIAVLIPMTFTLFL
ncbi:hypothetical protein PL8927_720328 [Planktothrix serta PCC 8927]|uniref:Uncharacterized protein n=1 Tax=Planktothrix serta PCC 8927 TaxID=671068 RepID=A0A7Z9E0Z6_9CYAN|nr:hypothetical protein PL8927_720328 [Planktothrix serta PCC 8927]